MDEYHIPVLLKEAIEYLNVKPGKKYIDGTLGGGGHSAGILEAGGEVLGVDQDLEAIKHVEKNLQLKTNNSQLTIRHGNFAHLKEIAKEVDFIPAAGILLDLGVSSHQLETSYRGFSFNREGKLDMRMDQEGQTVTAGDLVNAGSETELANLFWKYGEERNSRRIAKAITEKRKEGKIETTDELAKIILGVAGRKSEGDRMHPATRVFQALRMAVNDELASLEAALAQAGEILEPGGRLVVITFHSLEDRIVKDFFRGENGFSNLTQKPIRPNEDEIKNNPRARSGKLRAGELK